MKRSNQGFTLIELLTVVLIIGILTSVALPNYTRSVERSRAVEAMASIKSINDSIYTYYAKHQECPTTFDQLMVDVPGGGNSATAVGNNFTFKLGGDGTSRIFGTNCSSVVAVRQTASYEYRIWNPYTTATGVKRSLACKGENPKSTGVCDSLDLSTGTPPMK